LPQSKSYFVDIGCLNENLTNGERHIVPLERLNDRQKQKGTIGGFTSILSTRQ
jgi:hypothetical protein